MAAIRHRYPDGDREAALLFEILGLSAAAEAVYTELVSHADGADAADAALVDLAARHCGEPAALVAELEVKGLIAARAGEPGRYDVAPPAVALQALLATRRHALHQAETAAAELAEAYRLSSAVHAPHDLVEVVSGRTAIGHRFAQLQTSAVKEVLALVTSRVDAVAADDNHAEDDAVDRGVVFRVVLELGVLEAPGAATASALAHALGRREQVRVAAHVPTKMIVVDGAQAMLPLTASSALIIRAPALVGVLAAMFEGVWRQAQPVRLDARGVPATGDPVGAPGEPDPLDLTILSLLLVGSTDAAVANQLGIGLRTVQRRIRRLMEIASVDTRIQLGWQARDRGWIPGQARAGQ